MKRLRIHACFLATALLAGLSSASTILWGSETAVPGTTINIVGSDFLPTTKIKAVYLNEFGGESSGSVILNNINPVGVGARPSQLIQAQLPSYMKPGMYRVCAVDGTTNSNSIFVNKARPIMCDAKVAQAGATIHVYGRNMTLAGTTAAPKVRFVDANGNSLFGTVTASTPLRLDVVVPTGLKDGTTYTPYVNNGAGQGLEVACPPVVYSASTSDPLGVGGIWAPYFSPINTGFVYDVTTAPTNLADRMTGDGTPADAARLRKAIAFVAAQPNGGIVYIPAGTYNIGDGNAIELLSKVIIKGAGLGVTILKCGTQYTPSNLPTPYSNVLVVANSQKYFGFSDLTIRNDSTADPAYPVLMFKIYSNATIKNVVFKNVEFGFSAGNGLSITPGENILISGCSVSTLSGGGSSALNATNVRNLHVLNSSFRHNFSRDRFNYSDNVVVRGCYFSRDVTQSKYGDSGDVDISYARQLMFEGNTVTTTGTYPDLSDAHNELLLSQCAAGTAPTTKNPFYSDYEDSGQLTGATDTSITDSTKNWSSASAPWTCQAYGCPDAAGNVIPRSIVAIVDGRGMGQWRTITGRTATTLTVDRPWTVVPDSTSLYSINSFPSYQQYILGNTVSNGRVGIDLYDGAIDCVIDGNTQIDTGWLQVRANTKFVNVAGWSPSRCQIAWGTMVSNNTCKTTVTTGMPAAICFNVANVRMLTNAQGVSSWAGFGVLMLANEMRSNSIQTAGPTFYNSAAGNRDGYWIQIQNTQATQTFMYANLGSIFLDNFASVQYPSMPISVSASQVTSASYP